MAEGYLRAEAHQKTFEELVLLQYQLYRDVFAKESFDQLPQRKPWDHAIELKPGSEPFRTKIYPLSPVEQTELDEFLDENLRSGRIQPSKSPMASPVFFVKKKDGSLRLVQDYRRLNDMTIKNSYPLPLISDIMGKLKRARYFTKLDVRWGYNNVRIREGDEWKAAFRTNRGLFEPLVMFFGLTNSPATFQTMMNDLFKDLIDEGVVIVYIDDILIFTEDLALHRKVVCRVLDILRENGLYFVRATLHWEQDYPRNREGYCFNPEGLFQPAEQRTEEQRKRVVFQLRGLTGIVSTWTHRERDNRQVERERGETQRVVDKE